MGRLSPVIRLLCVCACSLSPVGCGMTGVYGEWDAPTEFRFASLTENEREEFKTILEDCGVTPEPVDSTEYIGFRVEDIDSTWHLARILRAIERTSKDLRLASELELVTFEYGGLNASASARATVRITVSRGASACIADGPAGNPWRSVRVSEQGIWEGEVRQDGIVDEQDGWVFVAATKDGELFRFFRVNVLTGQQKQSNYVEIREAGLDTPAGCGR